MPTKPVDSRKLKSGGGAAAAAGPSGSKEKRAEKKKNAAPSYRSPFDGPHDDVKRTRAISPLSFGIQDAQRARVKRNKRKSYRRFISLSLVSYLGYGFFYACGSPFDETSDKPAICGAIDPIKLDLYKAYQSNYYQSNIDPHVAPIVSKVSDFYNNYGVPAQVKVVSLYDQHGKPLVNKGYERASQVYVQHVEPQVSPLVAKSKIHADQVKIQLQPYYQQASKQATQAQLFAKQQWDNLPPPVKQAKDQAVGKILEYYHRAENTDMLPILTEAYWKIVDFYQYQFIPFIQTHPTTAHVNKFYDENIKSFVETNIKPLLLLVKDRTTHVNQLFNHALTLLPQRSLSNEPSKSTVASSIVETKTPIVDATKVVSDIPLTTTPTAAAAAATTKTIKSKAEVSSSAEPASSAVPIKEEAVSTPVKKAATAATTATGSIKTEATIAKDAVDNDQDIVKPVSVRPTATPEYVEMEVESPQADKKEAVYCPTCNAAEEQVIIAPTDKHVVPVRDEKEVFEIHTDKDVFEIHADKDVFEVNKEPVIVPPQSPAHVDQQQEEEEVNAAAPIKQDASKVKDQTAPIKKEQDDKNEEEEEQVFSTQVEHDVEDDGFPEPAVPLKQNDDEEEEKAKEAPVVTAVVDKQQVEIPLPVATEKTKENVAMPNDESEYEESKDQIVIQAPAAHQEEPVVKKEAIDVEPILKEPIVPNDESKFEAKSEFSNQDADPPVRYHRVEKALSQCPY